jgi:PAS domain S-box-containing protein
MSSREEASPEGESHHSPEMLRLLLEQARDHALIFLDTAGKVSDWLAGAQNILGYDPQEIVGQPFSRFFTPEETATGIDEHELRIAREQGKSENDRWQVRKDGARIWVTGVTTALHDETGELVGYGKVLRDRTDMKAHIGALESRGSAEEKNRSLAVLAHELGTTLASLRITTDLALARAEKSEDVSDQLRNIQRQAALMGDLVKNLMDVTRLEEGKLHLDKRRLILNDVLEQAAEMCRPLVEDRRQELQCLLPPSLMVVEGDRTRLCEVFINLIGNASKYTPQGGRVVVKMTTEGSEVVVKVEDNGEGIAPDMLPRLFELFSQEASVPAEAHGGLGIGLWLVRSLVAMHGGTVSVRSEGKGKGSEFAVRLPLLSAVPLEESDDETPDGEAQADASSADE